ncbi:TetR/AcrR family transcriptional regulator [Azotosporobacter soli]|uniref:TetR/AcrR family transcriptional regulator n=1 Tax=Azotosporobacter soli TaxID=3055040 RepID=UPI0031FE92B4
MRNRILMGAFDEINSRGVKFTMSNLAKRLNLSKTSLYEHFSSKNELVHNIILAALEDIQKQEDQIYNDTEMSVPEKIEALIKIAPKLFGSISNYSIYDDLRYYYPDEWHYAEEFREKQQGRLVDFIIQNTENQTLRLVNIKVLKQILARVADDLFSFRFLSENNITNADALSAMADIIVYGLLQSNTKK